MHALPRRNMALGLVAALTLAACTGTGGSTAPSSGVPSSASPSSSSPSPSPIADSYWLRMTFTQAIAPLDAFAVQPPLRITGNGTVVVYGPVPAIYPGPLLPNLIGRSITTRGEEQILQAARDLGLLDGRSDFTAPSQLMGAVSGRIELTVAGTRVTITGDPSAQIECVTTPCEPAPGTPEAFGSFWRMLLDLPSWLATELGPEGPYVPPAYSLLVGPAPQPDPALAQAPADWPLDQPLATFGGPVANGSARCGTASGADADTLRPALAAANQLTPWVQDTDTSATVGLTVRPLVPGEDACRETFAAG
jgi:hypothetical protein